MKKILILTVFLIYGFAGSSQEADNITGIWWNDEKTTKIEVENKNGIYFGTIVYMIPEKYENGEPPKDKNNPEDELRSRSLIGLQILSGFEYDSKKKEWKNGKIHDPKSGNTYACYSWLENNDVLKLKGYVAGIRLLGRTSEWYRTEL